jgi:hypothetical protein
VFTDANGVPLRAPPAPWGKAELVDATFLARRLRVSPTLVRSACAAGLLDVWQPPGGYWRIFVDNGTWLPLTPREALVTKLRGRRALGSGGVSSLLRDAPRERLEGLKPTHAAIEDGLLAALQQLVPVGVGERELLGEVPAKIAAVVLFPVVAGAERRRAMNVA